MEKDTPLSIKAAHGQKWIQATTGLLKTHASTFQAVPMRALAPTTLQKNATLIRIYKRSAKLCVVHAKTTAKSMALIPVHQSHAP